MTTYALISDVHANFAALLRVMKRIRELSVEGIASIGDVVGYGPHPVECLRLVMGAAMFSMKGNHDHAVVTGEWERFNGYAAVATEWTVGRLKRAPNSFRMLQYLEGTGIRRELEDAIFVHGSPRDAVEEYLFPADLMANPEKLSGSFELFDQPWCFVGHTHIPGVFVYNGGVVTYHSAAECPDGFTLPEGARAIVNVGSVGQPRDGDPRACFATWDGNTVRWNRVVYPVQFTQSQIRNTLILPDSLARRLEGGR